MATYHRSPLALTLARSGVLLLLLSVPSASLLPSSPHPVHFGAPRHSQLLSQNFISLYAQSVSNTQRQLASPPASADPLIKGDRRRFDRTAFDNRNPGAASARWIEFLRTTAPLASDVAGLWASGRLRRDDDSLARSVRLALSDLGPTFVKLGQILSVREDVLGPVWASELAKLQDSVRPFGAEEAREAVERAFAVEGNGVLEDFDAEPVAAASIAQVHRATWRPSGSGGPSDVAVPVAVKVLRPGVADRVAVDLAVLLRAGDLLAEWAPRLLPRSQVDWRDLLKGLAEGLWMECDLSGEAERQETFRVNMQSIPGVFVPKVYASTQGVMVSEWVDGVPLRSIPPGDPRLIQAQALIRDAYCQSMFVDAFFHADCHGGNLLWVSDDGVGSRGNASGRLCILDCGLMVAIDPSAAEGLLRLSLNLAARDWASVVNDAVSLGFLPPDLSDANALKARGVARRILGPYLDVGGGARAASAYSASALFDDVAAAASGLPTSLPPDMVLLGRAVIQLEGLALRAYPDYRLVDDILPVAARIALRASPPSQSLAGEARMSVLSSLLFADGATEPLYQSTETAAERKYVAFDRLKRLLATARSDSGQIGSGARAGQSSIDSVEDILDELLLSDAIRDLLTSEAADIADALIRDALWKGTDGLIEAFPLPRLPNPLNLPEPIHGLESFAPRLSEEEKLVLLRLPEMFAELQTVEQAKQNGSNFPMPAGFLSSLMLTKIREIPSFKEGIRILTERALVKRDPKAQALVDSVAAKLRSRARRRLERTGVPADVAQRLTGIMFLTPW
mmetsp:Transcript_55427/g.166175  ORF Transcript_55427/g.166175 Transcript_55427/m.166175 type:complete len:796 (-) Transcript_55427:339-2726(-)